jgi:MFS family permease
MFYIVAGFVGLLGNTGGAAQQAMIADLLPKKQLTEGYGIQRVVQNMTVSIGPAIGGFIATTSFVYLFLFDAITSLITVVIVYYNLPETKPATPEGEEEESLGQSFSGYGRVIRDKVYMAFLLASIVMILVYVQMNSTMPVYLRDMHGIPPSGWGFILSTNALMVVLFQFWITRRISDRPPFIMMAFGTVFYLIGFSMYGFVLGFWMFLLAMIILTVGEMVVTPVAQALVAKMSPEDMRGRYMAMFGFSWTIPFAIGPLLAGYVSDNFNPNWVWYASGILSFIAILAFLGLHMRVGGRFQKVAKQLQAAPETGD